MGFTVVFDGIIFIEGNKDNVIKIAPIEADLSFKIGAQLKNLKDVKSSLAQKAKELKANCVINFTYGQKSRWLAIDDVAFFGKGIACQLSNEEYNRIIESLNS